MEPNSIHSVQIDTSSIGAEILQALGAAADQAALLQHVAAAAHDTTVDVYRDSPSRELRQCASRIRGVVLHALHVAAELQAQAGRLEGLAAARMAVEAAEAAGTGDS